MVFDKMKACLAALLMLTAGQVAFAGQAGADPAALAVAESYFSALQSGDRQALLSLFGGRERSRSEAQLSDPAYTQFLRDRYVNARLEVTDGGVKSGVSFVDIRIWLNDYEAFRERLVLKPSDDPADSSLHIVARKELVD